MDSSVNKATVGKTIPHESAHLHVAGEARYVDDIVEPRDTVYAAIGCSEKAHARIISRDFSGIESMEGVICVLTADDIPGSNNHGPVVADEFLCQFIQVVGGNSGCHFFGQHPQGSGDYHRAFAH